MEKTKLNFFIDALMFLTMMALAGLGLLIKYVLIPGRIAWAQYGRQMGLTWLGLDRHVWGAVHLYLAFLLLSLLLLHVILHWKIILGLFTRFSSDPILRKGSAPVFLVLSLVLLAFPLLVTPEVNEVGLRENKRLGVPSAPEGLPLATSPASRGEQDKIGLPVQSGVSEQGAKVTPQWKSPREKIHSSVWPKEPYYQAGYRSHQPADTGLVRQKKRTSTLIACWQPAGRWSPQGPRSSGTFGLVP